MKPTPTPRKRPKSLSIQPIKEVAPWVLLSKAAEESGLTELHIRKSGIHIRKFGNAHYVAPATRNAWILDDSNRTPQVRESKQQQEGSKP